MPSQIAPKPIVRKAPIKPAVPVVRKPIKKVSDKRAAALRVYEKNKAAYFKLQPVCEYPGCDSTNVTLHHAGGRVGSLLTDMDNFRSLCPEHHEFCELHPVEAKNLNLSTSRLNI